jgi:hypothetical protein
MKKPSTLYSQLVYHWGRVKRWLQSFPVPPTKALLLLILLPLPLIIVHEGLKKFFREKRQKTDRARRQKQRLTLSHRARLLKVLKKKRREKERESTKSREEKGPSDKDV